MKNNVISSSQFCFSLFLSSFASLLFINTWTSYVQIIYTILALVINYLVISYVNVKLNKILKLIIAIYFLAISTLVLNKFVIYMHSAIKSGPFWSILVIIAVTVYFCSRKGFEAFARASVIIGFFSVVFCIYIVTATIQKTEIKAFHLNYADEILQSLILLLPSAVYITNKEKILKIKKTHIVVYLISTLLFIGYCIFISSPLNKRFPLHYIGKISHIGVFKGGEFMFLVLITIGVIYFMLLSLQSVCGGCNHITGALFWLIINIFSIISLYFNPFGNIFKSVLLQTFVFIVMILSTLAYSVIGRYTHNKKIQQ